MHPRKLKIAMFSDSALPVLNGVSVSIEALVRELRAEGHSVHVFTAAHFGFRDPDPNTYRFASLPTPWARDYPLAVPPFYPLVYWFRKLAPDIIHTHTPFTVGFVGLRWAESHNIPIVSTYHTHYDKYAHYIPFFPKPYIRYKIAKHTNYYYNRVQHIITPSEASKKWLMRHSVHPPISVIPTGIPLPSAFRKKEVRARLGIPEGAQVLLYAGRIAAEKNMVTLIKAAAEVLKTTRNSLFIIAGDGPYRNACLELTRELGIGDRTRFVGLVSRDKIGEFYAAADVFMFASLTETQGLVVAEAMSYGLPCVVVDGGGSSEPVVHGESGLIVPNEAAAMANATLNLLTNAKLRESIAANSRFASTQLSCPAMASRILQIYEETLYGNQRTAIA